MCEDTIRLNIAARKNAEEAMQDILGYELGVNADRFWECLATMCAAKVGKVLTDDGPYRYPMDDNEARRFERQPIPRGQYRGKLVGAVPADYFAALADDHFSRQLRRYVASDHYRRRVGILPEDVQTIRKNGSVSIKPEKGRVNRH